MEQQDILKEAKFIYELGLEYFSFDFCGMPVKIRMNKDHARNRKNDSNYEHNLSLVNKPVRDRSQESSFDIQTHDTVYLQRQVFGVDNWSDVESEINDFLSEIKWINYL